MPKPSHLILAVAFVGLAAYLSVNGTRKVEGHVTELACPSPGMPTDCNPGTPVAGIRVRFQLQGSQLFYDAVTNSQGTYAIDLPQGRYVAKDVVLVRQPDGSSTVPRLEDWDAGPRLISVGPLGSTRAGFAINVVAQ